MSGLTVAVTGATGNLGTSVVQALAHDSRIDRVIGIARRTPEWSVDKTTFVAVDIAEDDVIPVLTGVDVVVHLAWRFQPTRDPVSTWNSNVFGAISVFDAARDAGVRKLVVASSVGAYSPGPKHPPGVDERWATDGWPGAAYTREKAYLERALDTFELENPLMNVVRMRPAFVFARSAGDEQRRLFGGPFLPRFLVRRWVIPFVPNLPGLTMQAVHSYDVGQAFLEATVRDVRGPFNIAAEPILSPTVLARTLRAPLVVVPTPVVRGVLSALWHLRLVPTSPDLLDAVLRIPVMNTARAQRELGWSPTRSATEAVAEFFEGNKADAAVATPPLAGTDARP